MSCDEISYARLVGEVVAGHLLLELLLHPRLLQDALVLRLQHVHDLASSGAGAGLEKRRLRKSVQSTLRAFKTVSFAPQSVTF